MPGSVSLAFISIKSIRSFFASSFVGIFCLEKVVAFLAALVNLLTWKRRKCRMDDEEEKKSSERSLPILDAILVAVIDFSDCAHGHFCVDSMWTVELSYIYRFYAGVLIWVSENWNTNSKETKYRRVEIKKPGQFGHRAMNGNTNKGVFTDFLFCNGLMKIVLPNGFGYHT